METCDPIGTPMEIKDKLDLGKNRTLVDATKYRSMIGALVYLTSSRLDIVHATYLCARYQAQPTEKHLKEMLINRDVETLQEYFRWNSILRRKAGRLVLEKARLYGSINCGSIICVSIRLLCPSSLDADTVNGLWLSLQQDSYLLLFEISHSHILQPGPTLKNQTHCSPPPFHQGTRRKGYN
ncbi:hypothetical protein Tco_1110230 [Tanacetum coccineum]|uniref:Reverse transcriptase Ty1/copia-type domain-containing protein n=1 Tax=Tanacetum coccineum TaxID=301880 RepID=A0ABQ5II94_9ASTR